MLVGKTTRRHYTIASGIFKILLFFLWKYSLFRKLSKKLNWSLLNSFRCKTLPPSKKVFFWSKRMFGGGTLPQETNSTTFVKIKNNSKHLFDILCASKGQLLLPMLMWKVRYFYNWTRGGGGSFCFCLIATRYLILTQSPLSLGFNSFYNFNRINKTATYINWLQMQHSWAFFSDSAVIETNNVLLNEESAVNWTRDAIAQSTVMTI